MKLDGVEKNILRKRHGKPDGSDGTFVAGKIMERLQGKSEEESKEDLL